MYKDICIYFREKKLNSFLSVFIILFDWFYTWIKLNCPSVTCTTVGETGELGPHKYPDERPINKVIGREKGDKNPVQSPEREMCNVAGENINAAAPSMGAKTCLDYVVRIGKGWPHSAMNYLTRTDTHMYQLKTLNSHFFMV